MLDCDVTYYPQWSRGMRAVRCARPAKFTIPEPPSWSGTYVCGTHARQYRNWAGDNAVVLDGIWTRKGHDAEA